MQLSIQNSYDRAGNVILNADAEIARTRSILASIDDLENELAKIGHIREIVKAYRGRIESLDQRLDQAARRRHWSPIYYRLPSYSSIRMTLNVYTFSHYWFMNSTNLTKETSITPGAFTYPFTPSYMNRFLDCSVNYTISLLCSKQRKLRSRH